MRAWSADSSWKSTPDLEMVSFGPTLRGVNSPDERLEIATVPKFWSLLCETLKNPVRGLRRRFAAPESSAVPLIFMKM